MMLSKKYLIEKQQLGVQGGNYFQLIRQSEDSFEYAV